MVLLQAFCTMLQVCVLFLLNYVATEWKREKYLQLLGASNILIDT